MRSSATSIVKDTVLVGAGHAHVGVLRMFGMAPVPGVRLTLVSRRVHTPYSGMLPGVIAGTYTVDEATIDTGPLCVFAGARHILDEATGLELDARRAVCRNRSPVPYDVLPIDIGSTPGNGGAAGVGEHAIPVKPIDGFLERVDLARRRVIAASGRARIAVVGAGAGGVELMLALHRRLRDEVARSGHDPAALSFVLVSAQAEPLPAMPARMRRRLMAILRERGIELVGGRRVRAIDAAGLRLVDGTLIVVNEVFWTTQARAASWLADIGLALEPEGFIRVASTLQSVRHDGVFAAGDVASMGATPRPKSGVFAVRQGRPLAENLGRAIAGRPLTAFRPQREAMYLLSTADGSAIGTRSGIVFEDQWVWRWKDRIDRRFMETFNRLPALPAAPVAAP